jgi:hypothetical protein
MSLPASPANIGRKRRASTPGIRSSSPVTEEDQRTHDTRIGVDIEQGFNNGEGPIPDEYNSEQDLVLLHDRVGADIHDDDPQQDWHTQGRGVLADLEGEDELETDSALPLHSYEVPAGVREAEDISCRSSRIDGPHIHECYTQFIHLLCQATDTESTETYIHHGLPYATDKARSLGLKDSGLSDEMWTYAIALVVHVWQVTCARAQHGDYPDEQESLSTQWASYFLSAHAVMSQQCRTRETPSCSRFKFAVQYWESRLFEHGGKQVWSTAQWLRSIDDPDLDAPCPRNKTADEYLGVLETEGKGGLAMHVLNKEINGPRTPLRKAMATPDVKGYLFSEILDMFASWDMAILKALIEGQLPRKAEIQFRDVYTALQRINRRDIIQPSIYLNCICDRKGISPTPTQWRAVCELMEIYITSKGNELAAKVDRLIHPSKQWPVTLAAKNLRRYTEWKSWLQDEDRYPDTAHREMVSYFAGQVCQRVQSLPRDVPLRDPLIEIGYSVNSFDRLDQHARHRNSNYLMNLSQALFEHLYPGMFRLQQQIVYACWRKEQTWLGEIVLTQLGQGYTEGAGGFSHYPAGHSNGSAYRSTSDKEWHGFAAEVYRDGIVFKELDKELEWAEERRTAKEEARRQKHRLLEAKKERLLRLGSLLDSMTRLANIISSIQREADDEG